ncbi:GNAT family protein [Nocardia sp. NPDC050710]|uniref:GNAT family N-acetyltransferase n=1 Tax=Nocardia sp. NPDC050710 TaxID=3157220 RepID=UPI0033DB9FCF
MHDHPTTLSQVRLGPVTLHGVTVILRPPRIDDYPRWRRIRLHDRRYIEPFWSSSPLDWTARHSGKHWVHECLAGRADARAARRLPLVIEVDGRFSGQIELDHIDVGTGSAEMGLWMHSAVARLGIGGLATALMLDFGFGEAGLQRITAPISPANAATAGGAAQLGFQREATMTRYFDVGGAPRDHELWAVTAAAMPPEGFAAQWIRRRDGRSSGDAPQTTTVCEDRPLTRVEVLGAIARYHAGRIRHLADPLRRPYRIRLTDPENPAVVARCRRLTDRVPRQAAWLRLSSNSAVPESVHGQGADRVRWVRELFRTWPGLCSAPGLVLAVQIDGEYAGEIRLFEADLFNRHARVDGWIDPGLAGQRLRVAATRLVVDYAFTTLGLVRIATAIEPDDIDAAEVAALVGMVREGRMRDFVGVTGHRADHDLWAVTTPR